MRINELVKEERKRAGKIEKEKERIVESHCSLFRCCKWKRSFGELFLFFFFALPSFFLLLVVFVSSFLSFFNFLPQPSNLIDLLSWQLRYFKFVNDANRQQLEKNPKWEKKKKGFSFPIQEKDLEKNSREELLSIFLFILSLFILFFFLCFSFFLFIKNKRDTEKEEKVKK